MCFNRKDDCLKKYKVIYADPPWQYKNYNYAETKNGNKAKRGIVKEYPTMTIEEIKNLEIHNIADDDCILFLWITFPLLQEGLDTIKAWGFTYKTVGFNWIKRNKISDSLFWGMGNWTRSNSEICLLAVKGKPSRISAKVHSVIETFETEQIDARIAKHSKKPDEVRDRIAELCGDVPRIELFARDSYLGWDCWGNEVESDIKLYE